MEKSKTDHKIGCTCTYCSLLKSNHGTMKKMTEKMEHKMKGKDKEMKKEKMEYSKKKNKKK